MILILFAIISDPQDAAATTRNGASNLAAAGSQVVVFLSTIVGDLSAGTPGASTTGHSTGTYPYGGVETGDGSTEPQG